MSIKIDKSVAMPARASRTSKYPWAKMKVGNSFLLPKKVSKAATSSGAYQAGIKYKMKFAVREFNGRLRCWRVK